MTTTNTLPTKEIRKAMVSAYHNRKVITWEDRKLIKEATQGLSRFEGSPPARKG